MYILHHEIMFFMYYVLSNLFLVLHIVCQNFVCSESKNQPASLFCVLNLCPWEQWKCQVCSYPWPRCRGFHDSWWLDYNCINRSNDGNPKCFRLLKSSQISIWDCIIWIPFPPKFGSMGMVYIRHYLPPFAIKKSTKQVGKYTCPMDPSWHLRFFHPFPEERLVPKSFSLWPCNLVHRVRVEL